MNRKEKPKLTKEEQHKAWLELMREKRKKELLKQTAKERKRERDRKYQKEKYKEKRKEVAERRKARLKEKEKEEKKAKREKERILKAEKKKREKKIEREKKKKQVAKLKRHLLAIKHKKKMDKIRRRKRSAERKRIIKRRAAFKKYYDNKKKILEQELKRKGDKRGYFMVAVTLNNRRIDTLFYPRRLSEAHRLFHYAIDKNRRDVVGHIKIKKTRYDNGCIISNKRYEILLIENIDGQDVSFVSSFRDENGKYVKHFFIDSAKHLIIDKDEWYIPEKYVVLGYNPIRDKKTGKWVLDNLVLDRLDNMNTKMLYLINSSVYIQHGIKRYVVTAKTKDEADSLYEDMKTHLKGNKYITLLGRKTKDNTILPRNAITKQYSIPEVMAKKKK